MAVRQDTGNGRLCLAVELVRRLVSVNVVALAPAARIRRSGFSSVGGGGGGRDPVDADGIWISDRIIARRIRGIIHQRPTGVCGVRVFKQACGVDGDAKQSLTMIQCF